MKKGRKQIISLEIIQDEGDKENRESISISMTQDEQQIEDYYKTKMNRSSTIRKVQVVKKYSKSSQNVDRKDKLKKIIGIQAEIKTGQAKISGEINKRDEMAMIK